MIEKFITHVESKLFLNIYDKSSLLARFNMSVWLQGGNLTALHNGLIYYDNLANKNKGELLLISKNTDRFTKNYIHFLLNVSLKLKYIDMYARYCYIMSQLHNNDNWRRNTGLRELFKVKKIDYIKSGLTSTYLPLVVACRFINGTLDLSLISRWPVGIF